MRIAASILVPVLCLGLGYLYYESKQDQKNNTTTVQVEIGQKAKIILPDGTCAWLNSASLLTYDDSYNKKERVVYLEGEAYFDVHKDKDCAFIVKTNDISIEALGTSFNVKAYPDDNTVAATLIEGSIRVISPFQSEILTPSEKLTFTKKDKLFSKSILSDAEKNYSWINNKLAFEQERLEDITRTLERMYNVRVNFDSDELKDIRFSGTIKNNTLESVLQLITFVSPVRYTLEKDSTVIIRSK